MKNFFFTFPKKWVGRAMGDEALNWDGLIVTAAGPASQYRMRVSNTFTVNVIFCPLKANTRRLENISCNRNEPKQYTNTWQIIEVTVKLNEATRTQQQLNLYSINRPLSIY